MEYHTGTLKIIGSDDLINLLKANEAHRVRTNFLLDKYVNRHAEQVSKLYQTISENLGYIPNVKVPYTSPLDSSINKILEQAKVANGHQLALDLAAISDKLLSAQANVTSSAWQMIMKLSATSFGPPPVSDGQISANELFKFDHIKQFLEGIPDVGFSQIMEQAKTIDAEQLFNNLSQAEIEDFQAYSDEVLKQQPKAWINNQEQNTSRSYQILIWLLLFLANYILTQVMDLVVKQHLISLTTSNGDQVSPKAVIIAAKKDFCEEQLSACRFVKATELYVRPSPGKKYPPIAVLKFGQAVIIDDFEVYEKDRDWVYINYYDKEADSYKSGWVYRRDLRRYIK